MAPQASLAGLAAAAVVLLLPLPPLGCAVDVVPAAVAEDDAAACLADDDAGCGSSLSLRQLRALKRSGEAQETLAAGQDGAAAAEVPTDDGFSLLAKASANTMEVAAKVTKTTEAEATAKEADGSKCTMSDWEAMERLGSGSTSGTFPSVVADCGHHSYRWFSFHFGEMSDCVQRRTGVSSRCATCFASAGQYGVSNCKSSCLLGPFCSKSCLDCNAHQHDSLKSCTGLESLGVEIPTATVC